jgi:hypothetical protein
MAQFNLNHVEYWEIKVDLVLKLSHCVQQQEMECFSLSLLRASSGLRTINADTLHFDTFENLCKQVMLPPGSPQNHFKTELTI